MGSYSKIEWTDATWNPTRGCTRVSEGCRNCYAEKMAARFSKEGQWGRGFAKMVGSEGRWTGKVGLIESQLYLPLQWKKGRRIFVNSTSDLFHEALPDEAIDKVFAVMALCPQHTFQILTKRPERMRAYFLDPRRFDRIWDELDPICFWHGLTEGDIVPINLPLPNVWLGTSVEDQDTADARIPHLLHTPAAMRFLSAEPLLGPIDLRRIAYESYEEGAVAERWTNALAGTVETWQPGRRLGWVGVAPAKIGWVISGGESGPKARPTHPDWQRSLRDQCAATGMAFFFKQHGEHIAHSQVTWDHQGAHTSQTLGKPSFEALGERFWTVGKGAAGRLLDGREHNEFPRGGA